MFYSYYAEQLTTSLFCFHDYERSFSDRCRSRKRKKKKKEVVESSALQINGFTV